MNLYEEHYELMKDYNRAKKDYEKALDKKVMLFYRTQPGAIKPKDIVNNISPRSDKYLKYSADLEILEFDIENNRNILEVRELRLKLKEKELRESKEILDKIYVLYFLKRMKVKHIAIKVNYTREWTYELVNKIKSNLEENNLQKLTK